MNPVERRNAVALRSTYQPRAAMRSERDIVEQMAQDLLHLQTANGSVDAEALQLVGWLQRQINTYGAKAREHALRREIRETPHTARARARMAAA